MLHIIIFLILFSEHIFHIVFYSWLIPWFLRPKEGRGIGIRIRHYCYIFQSKDWINKSRGRDVAENLWKDQQKIPLSLLGVKTIDEQSAPNPVGTTKLELVLNLISGIVLRKKLFLSLFIFRDEHSCFVRAIALIARNQNKSAIAQNSCKYRDIESMTYRNGTGGIWPLAVAGGRGEEV